LKFHFISIDIFWLDSGQQNLFGKQCLCWSFYLKPKVPKDRM
jgi:hypothetical protein